MKKILTILCILIVGMAIGIIIRNYQYTEHYKKVESYNILYKIRVIEDTINVREQPNTLAKKVYVVKKNEVYSVVDKMVTDGAYTWYHIVYSDRLDGWIASSNEQSWVEELK